MAEAITVAVVLCALQLLVFRVSQATISTLYFTTSSLFEHRSDVKAGAILFRLLIPFATGVVSALILDEHAAAAAAAAGASAWLLVLWPMVWVPGLIPSENRLPVWTLLMGFWIAYALLPIGGSATTAFAYEVLEGERIDWSAEFLKAVITSLPITLAMTLLGWIAARRIRFADEPADDPFDEPIEELPDDSLPWWSGGIGRGVVMIAAVLAASLVVVGRRNGSSKD